MFVVGALVFQRACGVERNRVVHTLQPRGVYYVVTIPRPDDPNTCFFFLVESWFQD